MTSLFHMGLSHFYCSTLSLLLYVFIVVSTAQPTMDFWGRYVYHLSEHLTDTVYPPMLEFLCRIFDMNYISICFRWTFMTQDASGIFIPFAYKCSSDRHNSDTESGNWPTS